MTKIYVLDTNVLLQDPMALFAFEENEVIIPAVVLEEIDSKKRNMDEVGQHARHVSRLIDEQRQKGRLNHGVQLENGGNLRVELNHRSFESLKSSFVDRTNDNRIIAVALNLKNEEEGKHKPREVILVSKDILVRVKADALGIPVEDYLNDRVVPSENIYKGYREFYVSDQLIDSFYLLKKLPVTQITKEPTYPFEFIILKGLNTQASALGVIDSKGDMLTPCFYGNEAVWGIKARNAQQIMALELLQRTDVQLVTLIGRAGTGKTLLALASGLLQTEDLRLYKKLLIARSIMPVGKDLGYLPGEKEEKLKPWLQPIYDNLEYLFNTKRKGEIEDILAGIKSIQTEAITYIRGRSIPEQFMIIDEAQNLTKHEIKTILTRVGEGTKIVLMGDPEQVDHPYLDQFNNGLTYVVERMKEQNISGHVKLERGERSKLAQIAADVL